MNIHRAELGFLVDDHRQVLVTGEVRQHIVPDRLVVFRQSVVEVGLLLKALRLVIDSVVSNPVHELVFPAQTLFDGFRQLHT